jgi:hypothetical protein
MSWEPVNMYWELVIMATMSIESYIQVDFYYVQIYF